MQAFYHFSLLLKYTLRKTCILSALLLFFPLVSFSQVIPDKPVSYRIFTPFVFNPAVAGSKDFFSFNSVAAFQNNLSSVGFAFEGRLSGKEPGYLFSGSERKFSGLGMGLSMFNEQSEDLRNTGIAAGLSWHFPVSGDGLSFLSVGGAVKGIRNTLEYSVPEDSLTGNRSKESFFPNLDLGMYYYGRHIYAGVSVNNILEIPDPVADTFSLEIPASLRLIGVIGYKFVIIKSVNFVFEPSLILETDPAEPVDLQDELHPLLKIYLEDFCFGMYFHERERYSFFFQYRYPRIYLGAYYSIAKDSPYYMNDPVIEITAGMNLSARKAGKGITSHW